MGAEEDVGRKAPQSASKDGTFEALKEASHDLKRRIEEKRSSRRDSEGPNESRGGQTGEKPDEPDHPSDQDGDGAEPKPTPERSA